MRITTKIMSFLISLLLPATAHAETWQVDTVFGTVKSGEEAWGNYLNLVLDGLFGLIGLITLGRIIYGAYRYTQAGGNPGEAKAAKRIILHAVYGLCLVLAAYLITTTLFTF